MKRYVYRNHQQCTCPTRREIREAVHNDMNERPQPMSQIVVPVIPSMPPASLEHMRYDVGDSFRMTRYIFETVCFTTAIWVEEHVENGVSCGHYTTHHSYFQVPEGVELPQTELLNEGHSFHDEHIEVYRGLDGEAYYRYRMFELERRLRELEDTRVILPREDIDDIHAGRAIIDNQPVRLEYFEDDEIFNI